MRLAKISEAGDPPPGVAATPPGTRVYAIGDSHGRLDLLRRLETRILEDMSARAPARAVVVYLGDYVDRGPQSADVIEHLITRPLEGFESVHLLGNHEAMMLQFLRLGEGAGLRWFVNGGEETLVSYGVDVDALRDEEEPLNRMRDALAATLPESHLGFLEGLKRRHDEGGYLFVHAGVDPERPLDGQDPDDLIWIREPFLKATREWGQVVVHGHSPARAPVERPNRIGIDTGAVYGGALTAVVLEGAARRYLEVS